MHKQHGGLWKSVQKITLLAADEHSWLNGENTEKEFCCCEMLNTWGLGVSTFGFCGCWAPRVFNAPYKCRFSASWYLTDRAYCEDIINVLQLLFPLLEQLLAMRGTCGCQTPTVRVDVIWTQRGSVVLNAESKMFYRSDQVDQQHCGDVGVN